MPCIEVFNGDADAICALHQLRLHNPKKSSIITGVKRDYQLLKRIIATCDGTLTVLDISSHVNWDSPLQLLKQGNTVHFFDHHFTG